MERYLHPLTDFGFKKLFGTEPNKNLLIDFLNQVLPEHHQIETLTYTKNEHLSASPDDRKAVFDLFCESAKGNKFIVEIQRADQTFFLDRTVYYSSFPIQEQAKQGNWNYKLNPVYIVALLNFEIFGLELGQDLLHKVQLRDEKHRLFYDKLTHIYIELPKFTKTQDELETKFDKWLYVFRHLAVLEDRPIKLQERVFEQLFKAAEIAKMTPEDRKNYEGDLKKLRDYYGSLDTAKEEGRKEERHTIARSLKESGADIGLIAKSTGLSPEEIEKL